MISFLRGELLNVQGKYATLLTSGGVGYRVALPDPAIGQLPPIGETVSLHTALVVREDAMELYGFYTAEERDSFKILTGISKVGARTALSILSIFRPEDLESLVAAGDPRPLTQVSGIGAKTAQHVFLELKYKLRASAAAVAGIPSQESSVLADTVAALVNLGYQQEECIPIVRELLDEEKDLEVSEAIRMALKRLARRKHQ